MTLNCPLIHYHHTTEYAMIKFTIITLLIALFLRICVWPPTPIHIEEVKHSESGVEYVCIYESRDDFLVA